MNQVKKYNQRLQDMPQVMNDITHAIGAITHQCALYFQENNHQLPKDINEKFAKCINMNHQLLVAAGMSCTALDQVHFHSTSISGLASKITGAGGGGCALCYLPTTTSEMTDTSGHPSYQSIESSKKYIIDTLTDLGMECIETTLGVDGVSALTLSLSNLDGVTWFRQSTFSQLIESINLK